MANRCDICGKRPQAGNLVSHSMRHTKRRFRPNIQKTTLTIGGERVQMKVCTRCLRTEAKTAAKAAAVR